MTPVQSPPQAKPAQPVNVELDYEKLASVIMQKIQGDNRFRGMPGPQGIAGKDGKDGTDGKMQAINYDLVNYDRVAKEVLKRLPPVRMEIQHLNGDVFYQEKPLGQVIALKIVE